MDGSTFFTFVVVAAFAGLPVLFAAGYAFAYWTKP